MKRFVVITALAFLCVPSRALARAMPDRVPVHESSICTPAMTAPPDIIGGDGLGERGKSLPVGPVVGTSVLAGLVAWVLAILRRKKRAKVAAREPASGERPATPAKA
jgi:hypothetical protein